MTDCVEDELEDEVADDVVVTFESEGDEFVVGFPVGPVAVGFVSGIGVGNSVGRPLGPLCIVGKCGGGGKSMPGGGY